MNKEQPTSLIDMSGREYYDQLNRDMAEAQEGIAGLGNAGNDGAADYLMSNW